jgi:hypothetical protein
VRLAVQTPVPRKQINKKTGTHLESKTKEIMFAILLCEFWENSTTLCPERIFFLCYKHGKATLDIHLP